MTEPPILSAQEIQKIKAEESLRSQIRNELTPQEKQKNSVLAFLNSAVGIWLLSSVTIGLITWAYSQWSESEKAEKEKSTTISKIDIEMTNRIFDFENNLNNASNYIAYQSAIYGFLRSANAPKQAPVQTVLNEYEDVSTRALLIQLKSFVPLNEKADLTRSLIGVNKIGAIFKNREMTTGEGFNNPLTAEMENERSEIKRALETVKLNRWKLE
jgi:hypothetical protein